MSERKTPPSQARRTTVGNTRWHVDKELSEAVRVMAFHERRSKKAIVEDAISLYQRERHPGLSPDAS